MASHPLRKILYVEDDEDIQDVAKLALEAVGGYELKVCSSGAEALDAVSGFVPDLLLLDVMMPDMDGPATLAELRKRAGLSGTPAVFMTAKVMPADVEAYKRMGAVGVIAKPFDPLGLAGRIGEIWEAYDG